MRERRAAFMVFMLAVLPACSPACFLKPTESFDAQRLAAAPDYATPQARAARPDTQDRADLTPPGVEDAQEGASADVFFVHPTHWFDREVRNDTLAGSGTSQEMVDQMIVSLLAITTGRSLHCSVKA